MECGDNRQPVVVSVMYPDSIITQRWNDVLAIRNSGYNGGYDFLSCQWYADGVPISGAIGTVYYAPDGLDASTSYSALLTRLSDGVSAFTCDIIPVAFDPQAIADEPTIIIRGDDVQVLAAQSARMAVYTLSGQTVLLRDVAQGESVSLSALERGIYIMRLTGVDGYTHVNKVVLR